MEKFVTYATLLLILISVDNSEGQCSMYTYTYTLQPPIPLDCNPFSNDSPPVWTLQTVCLVESTSTDLFEVHWFHRDVNGTINDLGQTKASILNDEVFQRILSFFDMQYLSQPFSESLLGQYWCEVVIDGTQTGAYSDGLTIIRPEEYDTQLPTCSGIRQRSVAICRDSRPPPPPPPPASTSSIPSTSPPSPVSSKPSPTSPASSSSSSSSISTSLTSPPSPASSTPSSASSTPSPSPASSSSSSSSISTSSTSSSSPSLLSLLSSSLLPALAPPSIIKNGSNLILGLSIAGTILTLIVCLLTVVIVILVWTINKKRKASTDKEGCVQSMPTIRSSQQSLHYCNDVSPDSTILECELNPSYHYYSIIKDSGQVPSSSDSLHYQTLNTNTMDTDTGYAHLVK